MSLISLIMALVVIGLVLYLINMLPLDETIKKIIHVVVIIFVILFVLQSLNWFGAADIRIGH